MKKIILAFLAFAHFGFAGKRNSGNVSTGKFSFKGKEQALRNMGLSEAEILKLTLTKPVKQKNARPVKTDALIAMRDKK